MKMDYGVVKRRGRVHIRRFGFVVYIFPLKRNIAAEWESRNWQLAVGSLLAFDRGSPLFQVSR